LAGDAALQVVSDTIVRSCRNSDTVARFGGDEFAVLLWNLTEQDAHAKARTFEMSIDALHIRLAADCVSVGASAGVAMLVGSDQIIRRADADMYSRKTAKGNAPRYQLAVLPAAS
jgi:diguanylate cyclase (GGDEF)-like protein